MTCIITPQDFSSLVTDRHRYRWTLGPMRHTVAALKGRPVAITTDTQTGGTRIGVTLGACYRHHRAGAVVEVTGEYGPTAYRLDGIGHILPLDWPRTEQDAKWVALRSYGDEQTAALRVARPVIEQRVRAAGGEPYGKYTITPDMDNVVVAYTPQREDAGRSMHEVVKLSELARAMVA